MRTRVKICGITNLADAEAAVEAGADALGFILYPKSPRFIAAEKAQEIIDRLPPFVEVVGVFVNPTVEEVTQVESEVWFSMWQLHGDETPEYCSILGPHRFIKAVALPSKWTPQQIGDFEVSAFLLDTPSPRYGGTGRCFDWNLVEDFKRLTTTKLILSGGLNVDNIAEAIKLVQPYGVDVNSGVESSPGKKDHKKMRELLNLCKTL